MAFCKYYKQQKYVSYDSGLTWSAMNEYQKGDLYETGAVDCGGSLTMYRWVLVDGGYICDGKDKYRKEIYQYSTDGGVTYYNVFPTTFRKTGSPVEINSEYCNNKFEGHYVIVSEEEIPHCGSGYKWNPVTQLCVYVDPIKIVKCLPNSDELTTYDTKYYVDSYYETYGNIRILNSYQLKSGIVGDCVTTIDSYAFSPSSGDNEYLTDVVLPDTIETIKDHAFYRCMSLASINLPYGLQTIGESAFEYCWDFLNVEIPNSVETIDTKAFSNCHKLLNITVPNSVSTLGASAFNRCFSATTVSIGSGITSFGKDAFAECSGITNATIANGVTTIGDGAFYKCSSLSSVTIPNSVTTIGAGAFSECKSLGSVTLPRGLTSISNRLFSLCNSLSAVTIPSGVTSIGGQAFVGCSGLTSIEIPSGVTSIGWIAFNNCSNLTAITVNAVTPPVLDYGYGGWPLDNTNDCPIYIPCESWNDYITASGWSTYANRFRVKTSCIKFKATYSDATEYTVQCNSSTTLTSSESQGYSASSSSMTSAEIGTCVTAIGERAFANCSGLTSIDIPSGITSIGDYAFAWGGLHSITIPDNVTSLGNVYTFSSSLSLSSVTIGNGVTSIPYGAFVNCSGLTTCNIGSGVTSIGEHAFMDCVKLSGITIPNSVTTIGETAFDRCTGLTTVTIGSGITSIGDYAFSMCSGITSITINATTPPTLGNYALNWVDCPIYVPCDSVNTYRAASGWSGYRRNIQGIPPCSGKLNAQVSGSSTEFVVICNSSTTLSQSEVSVVSPYWYVNAVLGNCIDTIGNNAFSGCSNLSSVTISNTVNTIGDGAFQRCTGLSGITIPNSVTTIDSSAFYQCSGLTSVTIPSSVTSIGSNTFRYCSGLTSITIEATTPPTLGVYTFDSTNNCTIYVPCDSINAYKAAWSDYRIRIHGIPPCDEPQEHYKMLAFYTDTTEYTVECDSSTTLTSTEVSGGTGTSAITTAIIGDCVEQIGSNAFYQYYDLTSVTIGSGVTNIGGAAFQYCSGLTSINIPDSVSRIESNAFQRCSGATELEIGSGITYIGNTAFRYCSALTSITIEATTPPTLGTNVFNNTNDCPIYVPCDGINAYKAASGWTNYSSRIYPSGTCHAKLQATYSDTTEYTLYCNSSTTLTRSEVIGGTGRTAITSANIGNCVEYIGYQAFQECYNLTSVTIGSGVTTIDVYAFCNCISLTSIDIPSGVTTIEAFAFDGCSGLTSVTVNALTPPTIDETYDIFNNCTNLQAIYVPASAVNTYKSASGWSSYSSIIQAIS